MTSLEAARWREIDTIFGAALEQEDPPSRARYLEHACGSDTELREAVERLLAASVSAGSFLETPLVSLGPAGGSPRGDAGSLPLGARRSPGTRGGAEGGEEAREVPDAGAVGDAGGTSGTGRVGEAGAGGEARAASGIGETGEIGGSRREEETALAAGTRVGRYRLVRELARGGMGTVFLAERADGEFRRRVALKVLRRGLDTDDVLARFRAERQILASLDHPHIARLLDGGATADGRPYLVMEYIEGWPITAYCDERRLSLEERLRLFCAVGRAVQHAHRNLVVHRDLKPSNILVAADGAPKLLDFGIAKLLDPALPEEAPRTRPGLRLMTPEYASPEQLAGEPVTTASDVYQLGLLLHRLLVGRRTFATPGSVRRDELPAPSDVVLRGEDPDAPTVIGGMPARRLRRRLRGDLDAIVGMALRPDPERRYPSAGQLVDDVERHLAGRAVLARTESRVYRLRSFLRRNRMPVAAAASVALLLAAYAATATVQSRRLARERDLARAEAAESERVSHFLVELFWAADPRQAMGDPEVGRLFLERGARRVEQLGDEPEMQARLMDVLGRVYYTLGDYERAAPLLERALENRRRVHGDAHPAVAGSLASLGLLRYLQADYLTAEALNREAAAIYRETGRTDFPQHAGVLKYLSRTLMERGDYAEAERRAREGLELRRRIHADDGGEVAIGLATLGEALERLGRYEAAVAIHRQALDLRREAHGAEHVLTASSLSELGGALRLWGDLDEGERLLREALAMQRRLLDEGHPEIRLTLERLALLHQDRGEPEAAESLFREVLAMREGSLGAESPAVATSLSLLAGALRDRGDAAAAEPLLRRAVGIGEARLGQDHPRVAADRASLAGLLAERGQGRAADSLSEQALALLRRRLPAGHPAIADALVVRGAILVDRDPTGAEEALREAVRIRETTLQPGHWRIHEARALIGASLARQRRLAEAEALLTGSHRELARARGGDDRYARDAIRRLVELYTLQGRPAQAARIRGMLR